MINNLNAVNGKGWENLLAGANLQTEETAGEASGFATELEGADLGLESGLPTTSTQMGEAKKGQVGGKAPVKVNPKDLAAEQGYVLAGALAQTGTPVPVSVQAPIAGEKSLLAGQVAQNAKATQGSQGTTEAKATGQKATAADKSALNPKFIVGANTSAGFAGLKPWSKEWVFDSKAVENPELKTVFQPSTAPLQKSGMGGDAVAPELAEQLATLQRTMSQGLPMQADATGDLQGLAELNGVIEGLALAESVPNPMQGNQISGLNGPKKGMLNPQGKGSLQQGQGTGSLSGSEFLSTLGIVKQTGEKGQDKEGTELKSNLGAKGGEQSLFEKEISARGAQSKEELKGFGVATQVPTHHQKMPSLEVAGHVASGANAQDRLTSESLIGLSSGIKGMGSQGGEIRVRLKPDNLGEIHLKVSTNGKEVGLQIQANSEKAKEVLEASLSHLKENLATQNLNLGRVELSVASASSSFGSDMRNDPNTGNQAALMNQNGNGFTHGSGSDWGNGRAQGGREDRGDLASGGALKRTLANSSGIRTALASAGRGVNAQGRLDVTA